MLQVARGCYSCLGSIAQHTGICIRSCRLASLFTARLAHSQTNAAGVVEWLFSESVFISYVPPSTCEHVPSWLEESMTCAYILYPVKVIRVALHFVFPDSQTVKMRFEKISHGGTVRSITGGLELSGTPSPWYTILRESTHFCLPEAHLWYYQAIPRISFVTAWD